MSKTKLKQLNIPLFIMTLVLLLATFNVEKPQQINANSSYAGETTENLNVRSDSNVTSSKLGTIKAGSLVEILNEVNGFGKIKYGNVIGYISLNYVDKKVQKVSNKFGGFSITSNLPVRSAANAYASKLGTLKYGVVHQFTKHDNNWVKFDFNGKVGYVNQKYISPYQAAAAASTEFSGYVNSNSLVVRSGADTYSSKAGTVYKNQVFKFKIHSPQWYSFNFEGKTAYVFNRYITKGNPPIVNTTTFKGTPSIPSLNVRSTSNTYSSIVGTLKAGNVYDIVDNGSTWHSVEINGVKGYVFSSYVTTAPNTPVFYGVSNTPILNVRSAANVSSSKLGTIKEGVAFEFKEHNSNWYSFDFNGQTGYVSKEYITRTNKPAVEVPVLGDFSEGIAKEALNIRPTPDFASTSLGIIKKDEDIKYKKHDNTWHYVEHNGLKGYIYNIYVEAKKETPEPAPPVIETKPPVVEKPTPTPTSINAGVYFVNVSSLNVRAKADTNSTKIGTLTKNQQVEVRTQLNNGWSEISYNNSVAYVNTSYLTKSNAPTSYEEYIVNTNSLNVREKADALSTRIGSLSLGAVVQVNTKLANGWYQINYNGKAGFVNGAYLYKKDSVTTPSSAGLRGKLIAIDAGHGGHDPGALGATFHEKAFNLDMALRLKTKLESVGAKVLMIRSTDVYVVNSTRAYTANNANADLYVSIHANSSTSTTATGIDTFYYNSKNARGENSHYLASLVQNSLISATGARNRGVKPEAFTVISLTKMPSILLELGFISNPNDHQKLGTASYKNTLTNAIYSGLNNYFK